METPRKKILKNKKGMTYIELIVVLSIFSTLASVVLFNYSAFQSQIDIRNLSNDIGLKILQAQKSATNGLVPVERTVAEDWQPTYGIYIPSITSDGKSFSYFSDIVKDNVFSDFSCAGNDECLDKILLTKGNIISGLQVLFQGETAPNDLHDLSDLAIFFTRPSGGAVFVSSTSLVSPINYILITLKSPKDDIATIKVYPSGKIEIN